MVQIDKTIGDVFHDNRKILHTKNSKSASNQPLTRYKPSNNLQNILKMKKNSDFFKRRVNNTTIKKIISYYSIFLRVKLNNIKTRNLYDILLNHPSIRSLFSETIHTNRH